MDTRSREKFAEPRGWALKWVFTPEADPSTAEQEMGNNSGAREKFSEPRGWALKWDGLALSTTGKQQDGSNPSG